MMDIDRVRAEFPITERAVYLNHAAVGPIPRRSQRAMTEAIEAYLVLDRTGWADRDRHVRARSAALINARPDQIAFIKNTSEGLSLAANGIDWRAGDNAIVPAGDFPSVVYPWLNLAAQGVEARLIEARDGRISLDDLRAAIDGRTRAIAISTVQFKTGFRSDLAAIGDLCHRHDLLFVVDGIQSLGAFIPTEQKVALVDALSETGVQRIEATSFVHPQYVPQMADAEDVMRRIRRAPGVSYEVLVPNVRGLERAISVGVDVVCVVTAASDAFNQRNLRMSVDESLEVSRAIKSRADAAGVPVVGAISTCFGCPYSGDVPVEQVLRVVGQLVDCGYPEVTLADTTGMANPLQVEDLVGRVLDRFGGQARIGLHFHNTRGMGLANVIAGLRAGVTVYDASLGGIGGCPFAPRATGNIATEDLAYVLRGQGVETGIDLDALIEVSSWLGSQLGKELPGMVARAGDFRTV